ncbi:MAG: adenosine deaminase [Oligoflexia bacterium]|nr:adenosine deaminase [Oligoflexia bacterium]
MNTELHRHLDVSLRLSTLLELAQKKGLEAQSTSLEAFREKFVIHKPLDSLDAVLNEFTLFQKVLDRPEIIERVGSEVIEDCWAEGTGTVELRFSPLFVGEFSKLSWDEILGSFERGIQRGLARHPEMKAGLICIASRNYGPEEVGRTVEFFLANQTRFIGIDLAGSEDSFPCRVFVESFRQAELAHANITIHAGESGGPENVWEAIELLGAKRIGHGIRSIEDPALVRKLREKRICLEVCPTSNWLTRCVSSFQDHPLGQLLREGVPVSINTDDPAIFGTTLPQEFEIAWKQIGLSNSELAQCRKYAEQASFIR